MAIKIEKIVKVIKKYSINSKQYVNDFIEQYCGVDEYYDHNLFLKRIEASILFIKQKKDTENFCINIYDSHHEENKVHVLEIVHTERPFLLDSILNYLKYIKVKIINAVHVDFKAKYTSDTKLQFLPKNKKNGEDLIMIQIVIDNLHDQKKFNNLRHDIKYILNSLNAAVEDWQKIIDTIKIINIPKNSSAGIDKTFNKEIKKFLNWLIDKKFIFLALVECDYEDLPNEQILIKKNIKNSLGIARAEQNVNTALSMFDPNDEIIDANHLQKGIINIISSHNFSLIHRSKYMDCIVLQKFDTKGEIIGEYRILGVFSSIVFHQDARQIPLVNKKIFDIEKKARFPIGSENNKNLISILQDLPRENLFQRSSEDLFVMASSVLKIIKRPGRRVFLQINSYVKFINCLIFVPYNAANNELHQKIEKLFREEFEANLVEKTINVNEFELIQMQLVFSAPKFDLNKIDLQDLEKKIINLSKNWTDLFRAQFNFKDLQERYLLRKYRYVFSKKYQKDFDPIIGKRDIKQIEILLHSNSCMRVRFFAPENKCRLLIYNQCEKENLSLSAVIPMIDNLGMETLKNSIYNFFIGEKKVDIHVFDLHLQNAMESEINNEQIQNVEKLLSCVLEKTIESDVLNKLILIAGLQWRQVVLLRAILRYLKQLNCIYSIQYIQEVLLKYPEITKIIIEFFNAKFSPQIKKSRQRRCQIAKRRMEKLLWDVTQIVEETIFRYLMQIVEAMVRTNFFQEANDPSSAYKETQSKNYISFKIKSDLIEIMPLPRPYSEIFVYSKNMEGIHLKGGKVARGGIRWSDRLDDFRNEVLGLMKAQVTKNTVIVPTGAKGGFIIKNPDKNNSQDVVELYKNYLCGLLDLMDNIGDDGEIVYPENVILQDEDDYYIVAAADKGTSTFSNYANEISEQYQFWLHDAFASGGSNGYDHKKMQITSRGAWISVQKHFAFLGKNIEEEKFTVVGIGDMSGDVFGNGMLLSQNILLIGAFNHKHIFLDPNPNNFVSYQERKRLFDLPRSNWIDYDQKLISEGGGIFERSAKKITLSQQIRKRLNIKTKELEPNELIRVILKAPVDLLWNGGIGTYIKSEKETHASVFDKTNDALRINGIDLQAKVIGEGGNLGFTQLGRIEFANKIGKRINTDFIDNSAGVDCSDHEVNIKIALTEAMKNEKITLKERNKLMSDMTNEVAEIVLRDNHMQNFAITMIEIKSSYEVAKDTRLLRKLEEIDLINRKVEFLPDENKLQEMIAIEKGFSRPEICVLFSYMKMFLYDQQKIYEYDLIDDCYFEKNLFDYFPTKMHKKFANEIRNHKLRKEIIATFICNEVINRLGINFISYIIDITNESYEVILKTFFIIQESFQMDKFWLSLEEKIFAVKKTHIRYQILAYIDKFFLYSFAVLLQNKTDAKITIKNKIKKYQNSIQKLSENRDAFFSSNLKNILNKQIDAFSKKGLERNFITSIINLDITKLFINIIDVSHKHQFDLLQTAQVYFFVYEKLLLYQINDILYDFTGNNYWDNISAKIIITQFNNQHIKIVEHIISRAKKTDWKNCAEQIWQENLDIIDPYLDFVDKYITNISLENINLGNLNVTLNKIYSLVKKIG